MKAFPGMLAIVLMVAMAPAVAGPWRERIAFGPAAQDRKGGQHWKSDRPNEFRPGRQPERDERPHGRFTEEERRQLHRDLDKANRELYRPPNQKQ